MLWPICLNLTCVSAISAIHGIVFIGEHNDAVKEGVLLMAFSKYLENSGKMAFTFQIDGRCSSRHNQALTERVGNIDLNRRQLGVTSTTRRVTQLLMKCTY